METDGHVFQALVEHPETRQPCRPHIVTFVDVQFGPVGFAVGLSESADLVLRALHDAISRVGIPQQTYSDRGKAFLARVVDDDETGVLRRLGINSTQALPYHPTTKGRV